MVLLTCFFPVDGPASWKDEGHFYLESESTYMAELQGQLQQQRHLVLPAEWNIRKSHFFCELPWVSWFLRSLCPSVLCCGVPGQREPKGAVWHCGVTAGTQIRFDGLPCTIDGVQLSSAGWLAVNSDLPQCWQKMESTVWRLGPSHAVSIPEELVAISWSWWGAGRMSGAPAKQSFGSNWLFLA